jgi:hypothetical protein
MTTLIELKEKKAAKILPKEIDFGYCLPDCGACCPNIFAKGKELEVICEKLEIDQKSVAADDSNGNRCVFLYSYKLCLLHDSEERSFVCKGFQCSHYDTNRKLAEMGMNTPAELKKMWLQKLGNGYNRTFWLIEAADYLVDTRKKFVKKI